MKSIPALFLFGVVWGLHAPAAAQPAAAEVVVTGEPEVRDWTPPVYPETARR